MIIVSYVIYNNHPSNQECGACGGARRSIAHITLCGHAVFACRFIRSQIQRDLFTRVNGGESSPVNFCELDCHGAHGAHGATFRIRERIVLVLGCLLLAICICWYVGKQR